MNHVGVGVLFRFGSAGRCAIALLLIAGIGLGVLPLSVEPPLLSTGDKSACRFEPLDVCGADDASLGMLADTPVLLAESLAMVVAQTALPAPSSDPARLRAGFSPGVYRPPRPAC